MAGTTKLTPEQVRSVAKAHTQLADQITADQKTVSQQVQNAQSANLGAMVNKLVSVHSDWDSKMTDVVGQLTTMAGVLNSTANDLENQDTQNASGVHV
jgi:WXG100 family type VII secretion target